MFKRILAKLILVSSVLILVPVVFAGGDKEPTTAEKMNGLQDMCTTTEEARTERQAADSLYNRLGGYDRILELTTTIVVNHRKNPDIIPMLEHVDDKMLAKHVADFVAAGTGGTTEYTGRSLEASHAHLKLTDADFLSAGGDIVKSMNSMEYGQNEIDEFLCILLSLKDQVVFK